MSTLIRNRRSPAGSAKSTRVLVWGGIGLFAAYLLFFLLFGRMGVIAHLRLGDEAARIDREITMAKGEIAELRQTARNLNNDPHTIERIARERLGMVRPGETVFLFEPEQPLSAPASPEAAFHP